MLLRCIAGAGLKGIAKAIPKGNIKLVIKYPKTVSDHKASPAKAKPVLKQSAKPATQTPQPLRSARIAARHASTTPVPVQAAKSTGLKLAESAKTAWDTATRRKPKRPARSNEAAEGDSSSGNQPFRPMCFAPSILALTYSFCRFFYLTVTLQGGTHI